MARIAEGREPAAPSSPEQWERYQRILRAAIDHGSRYPLERVQMAEVARDAGVALGTLYRYFPSKTMLFTSVLHHQIDQLDRLMVTRRPDVDAATAVADLLIEAGRALLHLPVLAQSMLHSNYVAISGHDSDLRVSEAFRATIGKVVGIEEPSPLDHRLIRVVEQTWYGVLISTLNGFISVDDAEFDTRLACERLLADLGSTLPDHERTALGVLAAG